jgi:tetratricopeptide (TPR) repeat protein
VRHPALLLALGLAITTASPVSTAADADVDPQRKWLEIKTPNFTVVGDAGARQLRQVAARMEQLHAVLTTITERTGTRAPDTTVIVFGDRRSYRPFQPLYQGKPVDVGGYFLPGAMNYITMVAEDGVDYRSVVYHEYVHLVTRASAGSLPLWMSEGLAEFYSTFDMANERTARLGGILQEHIWRLQREFLPLAVLGGIDRESPYYNERDKSSVFYAQSWAFVHFLRVGREQKYAMKAGSFYEAVAGGMDFETACVTKLGVTPATLEEELREHLHSPVFFRVVVELNESVERIPRIEPTPVPEAAAHATLGHLLAMLDRTDEAREHFQHAVGVDAGQPLALALLADLSAEAGSGDQAVELARRAERANGHTYLTQYYRAVALERVAGGTAAHQAAIEDALRKSIDLNPSFAEAHSRLSQRLAQTPDARDEARRLQTRAIELAPDRDDYRLGLARILLLQRDTKAARNVLGPLVARGRTPEIRKVAREFLRISAEIDAKASSSNPDAVEKPLPAVREAPAPSEPATGVPPPEIIPELRPVGANETRILGQLTAIECGGPGVVLVIESESGIVRIVGPEMSRIEFISYRQDLSGEISCGPQAGTPPVLATYSSENGGERTLVAIEFIPPGYRPPPS